MFKKSLKRKINKLSLEVMRTKIKFKRKCDIFFLFISLMLRSLLLISMIALSSNLFQIIINGIVFKKKIV